MYEGKRRMYLQEYLTQCAGLRAEKVCEGKRRIYPQKYLTQCAGLRSLYMYTGHFVYSRTSDLPAVLSASMILTSTNDVDC